MADIAQQDKRLMDLQAQIERKEAQLKQDYKRLQKDVKQNPYLQNAVDEYKAYLTKAEAEKTQQIKALTTLLKYLPSDDDRDRNEIKREIKNIKRK
jgi:hypothetical protein